MMHDFHCDENSDNRDRVIRKTLFIYQSNPLCEADHQGTAKNRMLKSIKVCIKYKEISVSYCLSKTKQKKPHFL